jgi:hypothetical protein
MKTRNYTLTEYIQPNDGNIETEREWLDGYLIFRRIFRTLGVVAIPRNRGKSNVLFHLMTAFLAKGHFLS